MNNFTKIIPYEVMEKFFYKGLSEEDKRSIYDNIGKYSDYAELTTIDRCASFLAQVTHESMDFRYRYENLNYTAERLMEIFPKYFPTKELANAYAKKPNMIANRVYGNRKDLGNGDEFSEDGWNYRGRGYIQITGKNNYTKCSEDLDMDIDVLLNYLDGIEGSVHSAIWYWKSRNCNSYIDNGDIVAQTKIINGGYNGLEDRKYRFQTIKSLIG